LGALVAAHVAFVVLLNPSGPTTWHEEWLYLTATGVVTVQPMLFAAWLSLGPPPATKRIPLSIAALVVVFLASGIKQWSLFSTQTAKNSLDFDWLILDVAFFVAIIILGFIARKLFRWRIANIHTMSTGLTVNQFSLKYLLVLTTICAVLLSLGRNLAMQANHTVIAEMLTPIGLVLLAMFPALIVPVMALSKRPPIRVLLVLVVAWAALSWLGVQAIIAMYRSPQMSESVITRQVLLMQLGGTIAGGVSALVVRFCGYRLFSRWAAGPSPQPASS
jgi:hypothetical protein